MPQVRDKLLDAQEPLVRELLKQGLSAHLIHRKLTQDHHLSIGYSTLCRFLASLKGEEVFIPLHTSPGEEAGPQMLMVGRSGGFWIHGQI